MRAFRKVACAMSGGVDSSVTAYLLKQKGFEVLGIYMRNWDKINNEDHCTSDQDREDARQVCKTLGIAFKEVSFAKEYWNEIFSQLLEDYQSGLTPNPDIMCNKIIKFDLLFNYVQNKFGVDALATGHYARTTFGNFLENFNANTGVHLLQAQDKVKDQTFFLSQIPQNALQRTMFPLGNYIKSEVKDLAKKVGLGNVARKHESMGMCFIGISNFQNFIKEYVNPNPGFFVHIETKEIVGEHQGFHMWTLGQKSKISLYGHALYVVEKNIATNNIIVAPGRHHPSLYSQSLTTEVPYWIHSKPTPLLKRFLCNFRFQHRNPPVPCFVSENACGQLQILLHTPLHALTPGQFAVLYDKDVCLGSARIIKIGPSLYITQEAHDCRTK